MQTGQKLKFMRLVQGLSQQELSKEVGALPPYLARYESGVNEPKKSMTLRLANALGVNVEWLVYSTKAPFVFLASRPIKVDTPARQANTVANGISALLPALLKSAEVEGCLRFNNQMTSSRYFLFIFHSLDPQAKGVDQQSVLLLFASPLLHETIDTVLQELDITVQDLLYQGEEPDSLHADEASTFLRNVLEQAKTIQGISMDIDGCMAAWQQNRRKGQKARATKWPIPVLMTLESPEEITRETALNAISKAIDSAVLPAGMTLKLQREKV